MDKHNKIVYDANGVQFTIYEVAKSTKAGPTTYWLLVDHTTGKRRVLNNPTLEDAKRRADQIRIAMVKGQAGRMALSNGQWQDVCIALEVVRNAPTADSLACAVRSWAECVALLDGRATLLEAVMFYLRHHSGRGPEPQPTRFADAAKAYHGFKVKDRKSDSHCKNIKSRLERLARELPDDVMLNELTAGQLETVVADFGVGDKTRNEYRITLYNLFRWAEKQNPPLVPKGFNPAKDMERHHVKHCEVEFLRVAELRKVLAGVQAKRPDLLPLITLVCFSGLRPSEAVRLEWKEVGEDYIRLPGNKSKTGYSRQIPLQPNLKLWLAQWRESDGLVCPGTSLVHVNPAIQRVSGVKLSHDAMRHGYGTHRHAILKNVGAVASEMGNSPQICRRHYLNAFCTEQEAKDWFGIMPERPGNIIGLPEAQGAPEQAQPKEVATN